jgi:hypothetical protein
LVTFKVRSSSLGLGFVRRRIRVRVRVRVGVRHRASVRASHVSHPECKVEQRQPKLGTCPWRAGVNVHVVRHETVAVRGAHDLVRGGVRAGARVRGGARARARARARPRARVRVRVRVRVRGADDLNGGYEGEVSDGAVAGSKVDEVAPRCDLASDGLEVVT